MLEIKYTPYMATPFEKLIHRKKLMKKAIKIVRKYKNGILVLREN